MNKKKSGKDKNIFETSALIIIFSFDILRHIVGIDVPLPAVFSIELGILLVSAKIIWMIHKQSNRCYWDTRY